MVMAPVRGVVGVGGHQASAGLQVMAGYPAVNVGYMTFVRSLMDAEVRARQAADAVERVDLLQERRFWLKASAEVEARIVCEHRQACRELRITNGA
jgi:hypothetical protein